MLGTTGALSKQKLKSQNRTRSQAPPAAGAQTGFRCTPGAGPRPPAALPRMAASRPPPSPRGQVPLPLLLPTLLCEARRWAAGTVPGGSEVSGATSPTAPGHARAGPRPHPAAPPHYLGPGQHGLPHSGVSADNAQGTQSPVPASARGRQVSTCAAGPGPAGRPLCLRGVFGQEPGILRELQGSDLGGETGHVDQAEVRGVGPRVPGSERPVSKQLPGGLPARPAPAGMAGTVGSGGGAAPLPAGAFRTRGMSGQRPALGILCCAPGLGCPLGTLGGERPELEEGTGRAAGGSGVGRAGVLGVWLVCSSWYVPPGPGNRNGSPRRVCVVLVVTGCVGSAGSKLESGAQRRSR